MTVYNINYYNYYLIFTYITHMIPKGIDNVYIILCYRKARVLI